MRAESITLTRLGARGRLSVSPSIEKLETVTGRDRADSESVVLSDVPGGETRLYRGGEFRISNARGVDSLSETKDALGEYAEQLEGEIAEFEPRDATFAGDLTAIDTARVAALSDALTDCTAVAHVATDPENSELPGDVSFTVRHRSESYTCLVFSVQQKYALTDVPIRSLGSLEARKSTIRERLNERVFDTIRL